MAKQTKKKTQRKEIRNGWEDRKFEDSVRVATNTPEKLQYRVSVVMDILGAQYE